MQNLRAFALNLCRNHHDAEDLVQDTLVRALANQHTFETGTNLKSWLFTILHNTFIDRTRRGKRIIQDSEGAYAALVSCAPAQEAYVALREISDALDAMTEIQRTTLLAATFREMSLEDVAATLQCPVGTVKSRINRGRKRLAELVEQPKTRVPARV